MEEALKIALSKPKVLAKNPNIVQQVLESPEFKVIQKLVETGNLKELQEEPIPGLTINFDKVDITKTYPTQYEYGNLLHDVMIPGNAPVSQILHNQKDRRVLVPYANALKNETIRTDHLSKIREAMMVVCKNMGHPIQFENIITNEDDRGHAVLQIANKHVNNLEDNKKFTELVRRYLEEKYQDEGLRIAIAGGYDLFKCGEYHQKYPLLAEVPNNNYGVLQKLIHDPCVQPIIINVNQYISNIETNNGIVTMNNSGTQNNTLNSTQYITVTSFDDAVKEFIQSIKSQKPAWYKEGSWMHINAIRKTFDTACGQNFMGQNPKTFGKLIENSLGKRKERKLINGHKQVAILLKRYNELT